jgi:hypothetical protein
VVFVYLLIMHPSEWKTIRALGASIRGELHSFREVVRNSFSEQIDAIGDSTEASVKAHHEIRDRLAALRISENEKSESKSYRDKAHGQQVILTWVTSGAFLAAAVYAGIAGCQLSEMEKTNEIARGQLTETQNILDTESENFDRTMKQVLHQNEISRRSADAAKSAAETAKRQLTAFERSQAPVLHIRKEMTFDHVKYSIKNEGHGSAFKVSIQRSATLTPLVETGPDLNDLESYLKPVTPNEAGQIISEGGEYTPAIEMGLEGYAGMMDENSRGQTRVIYLTVTYLDIFGNTFHESDCVFPRLGFRGQKVEIVRCPPTRLTRYHPNKK